jgi:predicted nucleotidyltransferase
MNLPDLLKRIDAIFNDSRTPYALIGGYAVAAWGEERATRDIDLYCTGDSHNIIAALKKEHLAFEHRIGDCDDPVAEVIRIEMGVESHPFEVDILFGIKNAPAALLSRVRILDIEGVAVPVTSPEDMIVLRLLGGSPRHLEDAKSILQIQGNKLDLNLVRRFCPDSVQSILEKLLSSAPAGF